MKRKKDLKKAVICTDRAADVSAPRCFPSRFERLGMISEQGCGATSIVWRIQGEKEYILKEILCSEEGAVRKLALHEIAVMKRLAGIPNAMQLLDYELAEKAVYLLEPYVKPFSEWLEEENLPAAEAIRVIMDACNALEACAERGVLHLDIHPKNLFVGPEDEVILGDFGTALFTDEAETLKKAHGTLAYMAPEVYREGRLSRQADIYSLGVVLYALFNDRMLPFTENGDIDEAIYKRLAGTKLPEPSWVSRSGVVCGRLLDILNKMCAFQPEDRYPNAKACREALAAVLPEIRACNEPLFRTRTLLRTAAPDGQSFFDADTVAATVRSEDDGVERAYQAADWLQTAGQFDFGDEECCGSKRDVSFFDADTVATSVCLSEGEDGNGSLLPLNGGAPAASPVPTEGKGQNRKRAEMPGRGLRRFIPPFLRRRIQPDDKPVMAHPATAAAKPWFRIRPAEAPVTISSVQFSAVAPKTLVKGEYSLINIVMYEEGFRHIVDELIREADAPVSERRSGTMKAKVGARVMIRLTSPDLMIDDGEEEYEWNGDYLEFGFAVMLPEDFKKRQVLFVAHVYIDGYIATRLKFTAHCFSQREQKMQIIRDDVLSAFISYASKDRERVISVIQGMQKARPDMDIFFDVEALRSGEDWEKALYSEIERRDVLYLCWSHNASESIWVKREWEYAYATKGADGIEPIPIETPDQCPPPDKLASKHFNDRLLYVMRALDNMSKEDGSQAFPTEQTE